MLVRTELPSARRAVHLVFAGEKVRPEYSAPAPRLGTSETIRGLRLMPLADLVRMKLTSFRLKDQTHLKDLEEVGLLTNEIEHSLEPDLATRLTFIRQHE